VLRHARTVGVVERTDEPAAADNPLTRETKAALYAAAAEGVLVPRVLSVSAGLGSRDVGADDLAAVFEWLGKRGYRDRDYAVTGIRHPLALPPSEIDVRPAGAYSLRGHSIGGFGSVTTNKLIATIVGEVFDKHVQAYPRYGSEKKGLPTTYYLTIADEPVHTHAELDRVDFVPLHDVTAFGLGDPLIGLVDGGTLFIQSALTDPGAIWATIPVAARTDIVRRRIRVIALDTAGLARARSPRPDLVLRMQGIALVGVFLRVAPFAAEAGLDREALLAAVGERLGRFFGKRGRSVVDANLELVAAAYDGVIDVSDALGLPAGIERQVTVVPRQSTSVIGVTA
jgi:pyruvate-ferredoxin/flavodoxin oxidoreductase